MGLGDLQAYYELAFGIAKCCQLSRKIAATGGPFPQFGYATPPPPSPLGPLSYQGSTGHTYGGAKGA